MSYLLVVLLISGPFGTEKPLIERFSTKEACVKALKTVKLTYPGMVVTPKECIKGSK